MTDAGRRTRFSQKTKSREFVSEMLLADDFQRYRASEVDVDCLVSDPHGATTQFDRRSIAIPRQIIMLESMEPFFGWPHDSIVRQRLAEVDLTCQSPAKHANGAEFVIPCDMKRGTANWTNMYFSRLQFWAYSVCAFVSAAGIPGVIHPSAEIKASRSSWISARCQRGLCLTCDSSRTNAVYCFRKSIPIFPASHLSGSRINSRNAGRARAGAGARAAA